MDVEQTNITEIEINPRTGLPYKQSNKVREQKRKWALNNMVNIRENATRWQNNNRKKLYACQVEYMRRRRAEHKYLLELFNEGLNDFEISI